MSLDLPAPSRPAASVRAQKRFDDPGLFINRELAWLEFNARVLAEAADERVPLYERLKFLSIFANNLDEFFMVRVAGLQAQLSGEIDEVPPDGLTPVEQLTAISVRAHELVDESYRIWEETVQPKLREIGIALISPDELAAEDQALLDEHFRKDIFPVLTPIVVDPAHPFPHVRNKSINVGFLFDAPVRGDEPSFGVVQVPMPLGRMIRVPREGLRRAYVLLEDLILRQASMLFPQMKVVGRFAFRVTRNFDIELDEDEAEDLLLTLQAELRRRERGHAVRLSVSGSVPPDSQAFLCRSLDLDVERDVFKARGPLYLADMMEMTAGDDRRDLRDEPYSPVYVPPLRDSDDLFETIRERDVLLHHPYETFEAVVDFVSQAAEDPQVLAIKQTLYRTGGESPVVRALQRAAELGKQVTAVVELKARFDEASNMQWARALERSGVNVMYGLMGMKTHAKVLLVVRRERTGIRRYVHLATGNYNQQTARLYTDLSLFTANEEIGEDASALFNLLTGYSAPPRWNRMIVAPLGLHEAVLGLIARETEHARSGRPAKITAKMNSLVDADVIAALYSASQAGVEVDLLVRGICCLRPGVKGASENIRVRAVVDRFLEHSRIFHFGNGGNDEVYLSSADWMPRNFRRRVEVMWPVLDESLKRRVVDEILGTMRADTAKGWVLEDSGSYVRALTEKDGKPLRSQYRFMELSRERSRESEKTVSRQLAPAPAPTSAQTAMEKLRKRGSKKRRKQKRRLED
ncbi:MAG: polyphosphate kinase 1 [Polyangiaceae bacterium]|nr:polyphosphate kinase 1 [Polyangiaceae bacterium]MCE7892114.1 polyphosphate kinase 1 [Sorangiineae bacterium PRO1]MCL4752699.1 polyphosphate kinase 1 [Myxococcales bacterium]